MKKIWMLMMGLGVFSGQLLAQQYAVSLIPDSLKKGANVVVRVDKSVLTIDSKAKATYKTLVAITILNEKGDQFAGSSEWYDQFRSIESIDGNLYDANGEKIKSLKKSDIKDLSGMGGGTSVSDDRQKAFGFYHKVYPFTAEFEVTVKLHGLMFLPDWYGIGGENMGVQQSSLEIVCPNTIELLTKTFNYPGQAAVQQVGSNKVTKWEVSNLKPMTREYAAPPWYEITPAVFCALKEFEISGYNGSYESWEKFGNFVYTLIAGRDVLPAELKTKVKDLVAGKSTTSEKVAALYTFMQQNTRYISVQLGIGGWQPFDANYVYTKKYGDCKALTNYMYSLLKEAGIPSIYTLVKSGSGITRFMTDFPSSQFNHVILCVPNGNDSIWLECTSQTIQPGYLGDFTNNRPVLLVKQSGSQLVKTPIYNAMQNSQVRKIDAVVNEDGSLKCNVATTYRALQQDDVHGMIHALPADKQKEELQKKFSLGTYVVNSISYKEEMKDVPEIVEELQLQASHYAQVTGKRLMITPNMLSRFNWRLDKDSVRAFDIVFTYPYTDIDSATITVGKAYKVESMPKPVKIVSEFGSFESNIDVRDGVVYYYRKMVRKDGRYPPEKWETLVKLMEDITKADKAKLVLVKSE
ncbi:MAG TPA: DUF3857 and transglutaminase domain-containing protein [Phnomibacter sp.]|nr:DUF3857 and transglutaminase domain-containing protein [Phnomibacter sp.]